MIENYENFMEHLPYHVCDKSLIALKGHLLVETVLREYIYARVPHPDRLRSKQIQFSTLVDFASSLEDSNEIQWVWKALKKINQIRNQLAHNLSPEKFESLERDLVSYVEENDGRFSIETEIGELVYDKLALVIFQVFDVIAISVVIREHDPELVRRLVERFSTAFENMYTLSESKERTLERKWYEPSNSKKRRKKW